jgi:hypothetical protein
MSSATRRAILSFPMNILIFSFLFGMLCHNNIDSIEEILRNVLPKMKLGGHPGV